jgi:hypothetical protein
MCFGDDARNSYGIPKFPYKEGETVFNIIKRVITTPRFEEVGSNTYVKSWVFLFNGMPIGYITHKPNEIIIKAFVQIIPSRKLGEITKFYFDGVRNEDLRKYLNKHGIKQKRPSIIEFFKFSF